MISIAFEKYTLPNGLQVILHEDHSLPMAAVNIWYHVGSKDEDQGRTGFAHLFEHVMFEGSKNHNELFFNPLMKVGGSVNGSTSSDRTNYWENVPSDYLELALWLESDRMGFLLDALDQKRLDLQRDVVKNERRQSYENRPYGTAYLLLQPALFPAPHPYSWPVIGSQEDLDAASLDDVKSFFRRFYSPSNATISIAGGHRPGARRGYWSSGISATFLPRRRSTGSAGWRRRCRARRDSTSTTRCSYPGSTWCGRRLRRSTRTRRRWTCWRRFWRTGKARGCTGRWCTRSRSPGA